MKVEFLKNKIKSFYVLDYLLKITIKNLAIWIGEK